MARHERPATAAFWPGAWILATLLVSVLSVRLAELLPLIPKLRPGLLALFVVFPFLVWRSGARAALAALKNPIFVLLALCAAWAVIGVPFALWKAHAAEIAMAIPIGTTVVIALLLCAPSRAVMDRLGVAFLMVATAYGGVAYIGGRTTADRLTTIGAYDPNGLASVMASALPFGLALILRGSIRMRIVGIFATLVIGLVLVATGSRGGMVGVLAALLVLTAGMRMPRAVAAIVIVALASPLAWHLAPPAFRTQLASMTTLQDDYNMTEEWGRLQTWKRGIAYTLANPVTGLGAGNFPIAEGARYREENRIGLWYTAHNSYVQAFAEFGIPGGLLFLALLWRTFRTGGRLWRSRGVHRPEYLAALAAFCAAGFFLSHAFTYHPYTILGLIAHAGTVAAHETRYAVPGQPAGAPNRQSAAARHRMREQRFPIPAP